MPDEDYREHSKNTRNRGDLNKKFCPRCNKLKLLEAYRRSARTEHVCPDDVPVVVINGKTRCRRCSDSYCKACRRVEVRANRARENARARKHSQEKPRKADRQKTNARRKAQYHYKKPKRCTVKLCNNRAHRHHVNGYDKANATNIQWLCPTHHALSHIIEKARRLTEPSHY